uniref:Uncharacterized protein n=1 Tax=Lutzomyia longipalpis TaxID=7200 RepID=A0A1B0CN91_LUTLO
MWRLHFLDDIFSMKLGGVYRILLGHFQDALKNSAALSMFNGMTLFAMGEVVGARCEGFTAEFALMRRGARMPGHMIPELHPRADLLLADVTLVEPPI